MLVPVVLVHQTFKILLLCLLVSDYLRGAAYFPAALLLLYYGVIQVIIELRGAHRRVIVHIRLKISRVLLLPHL